MPTCKEDVADNVIVIRSEKTLGSRTHQTDEHRTPCQAISDLLLNQLLPFPASVRSVFPQVYHIPIFFYSTILATRCILLTLFFKNAIMKI